MVMMAISSRASGCWDSLGCPYGIFFERDPWKRTKIRAVLDRISTGSRTRVPGSRLNGGNPPLVSPMGLVWHQSPPYIPFSFSSTPHRGRSRNKHTRDTGHVFDLASNDTKTKHSADSQKKLTPLDQPGVGWCHKPAFWRQKRSRLPR